MGRSLQSACPLGKDVGRDVSPCPPPFSPGPRLSGGHSLHETSTVLVETVTKASSSSSSSSVGGSYSAVPKFSSDASKVVARGPGLTKAFVGQKNTFTVDCSKAGERLWDLGWGGRALAVGGQELRGGEMGEDGCWLAPLVVKAAGSFIPPGDTRLGTTPLGSAAAMQAFVPNHSRVKGT